MNNFEGVFPGSIIAINLDGNYKLPHLAKVTEITNTSFIVQWLKGVTRENGHHDVAGLPAKFQRKVSFILILN